MQATQNKENAVMKDVSAQKDLSDIANRFLLFVIAEKEYAVNIANVTEIIYVTDITPVPFLPDCINGLLDLRGDIVPVIDVRKRFGLEVVPYTDRTNIIVMQFNKELIGLIVDSVLEVVNIDPATTAPVSDNDRGDGMISAIGWYGNRKQFFIDFDEFLKLEAVKQD